MALEFSGTLFAGNFTGPSLLVGVGHNDRYNPITADTLTSFSLYANIHSADIITTAEASGSIVCLKNDDFSGPFAQVSDAGSGGEADFTLSGYIGSVLLIASDKQGKKETRVSFREQFLAAWDDFLDKKLAGGSASREGEPTLTWEMFPASVSFLDPNQTYLKIYQPLHIHTPWPFSDYAASMTYHIVLFIDGSQHVRAWGARWACWVESGIKHDHILGELSPQVRDGLSDLQDQANAKLAVLDLLGPLSDVYYLPGQQTTDIGTGVLTGNTSDDVTIVLEH
jgi:hypothetical protein